MSQRDEWETFLRRYATPVLEAIANGEDIPSGTKEPHLTNNFEALVRTAYSVVDYMYTSGDSSFQRLFWSALSRAIDTIDMEKMCRQNIIEFGYLSMMFIRYPRVYELLEPQTRKKFEDAATFLRKNVPPLHNNYVLMWAMPEAFLRFQANLPTSSSTYKALSFVASWYKGDSLFGDGVDVQVNYYNSLVIYPALSDILTTVPKPFRPWTNDNWMSMYRRHAHLMERVISPEGTFPVIGRSACYRMGIFHGLSRYLGDHTAQAQSDYELRGAISGMTAVLKRMAVPMIKNVFLDIGFLRDNPRLAEFYICTGSLYATGFFLKALKVPAQMPLWNEAPWTQKSMWDLEGELIPADSSIGDPISHIPLEQLVEAEPD